MTERQNLDLALEKFAYERDEKNDPVLSGFAIHEGKFNGLFRIEPKEIANATRSMKDAVFLTDHTNKVDNAVGRIIKTQTKADEEADGLKGTFYKAFIDSEEHKLLRKIEKGIVSSTSIGFSFEPVCSICGLNPLEFFGDCPHWTWDEGFEILCQDVNVHELSCVPVPADKNATVKAMAAFEEKFEDVISKKKKNLGNNMVKENKTEIEELKQSHADEIKNLKQDHADEIQTKVQEVLSLNSEKENLETQLTEANDELKLAREALKQIKEAELSVKRTQVTELSEKLNAGLTPEQIAELSEETLDGYLEIFNNQVESSNKQIEQQKTATQTYTEGTPVEDQTDLTPEQELAQYISNL